MSEIKSITKSIQINATAEKVWEVLFGAEYYPQWAGVFAPGSKAESDWSEGSQVLFTDESNSGICGHITTNKQPNLLEIEYDGEVVNGSPVLDSPMALSVKGTHEIYELDEKDGITTLNVKSDMDESYYDEMNEKWDEALEVAKNLSEK